MDYCYLSSLCYNHLLSESICYNFRSTDHIGSRLDKTNNVRYFCLRLVITGQWVLFSRLENPLNSLFPYTMDF